MKKLARAFMGRGAAYARAIDEGEDALAAACRAMCWPEKRGRAGLRRAFAHYVLDAKARLDAAPIEVFLRGRGALSAL